jgi:hypothetical protein
VTGLSRAGSVRLRLLNDAAEGALLTDTAGPQFVSGTQIEPPISRHAACTELEGLVWEQMIELYEWGAAQPLRVERALATLADDANWLPGRSGPFSLALTDKGHEEYLRAYPASADEDSY